MTSRLEHRHVNVSYGTAIINGTEQINEIIINLFCEGFVDDEVS